MIDLSFFLDIIKISISGLITFFVAWFIIREFLIRQSFRYSSDIQLANLAHTLPLKLQAYERITLFLERINPANMLVRLHVGGLSAREMHHMILSDIRAEYQHNISQQIYITDISWNVVKKMKDETIGMIHSAINGLPETATSIDLSKLILSHFANLEDENPYEKALQIIKKEVQKTL